MSVLRLSLLYRFLRENAVPGTGLCLSCRRLLDKGCPLRTTHRWSSSVKPKDEVSASDFYKLELLEVLQTRLQQLQAETEGENGWQEESKTTSRTPERWMEKLKMEEIARHKKQKALNSMKCNNVSLKKSTIKPKKSKKNNKSHSSDVKNVLPPLSVLTCSPPIKTGMDIGMSGKVLKWTSQSRKLLLEEKDGNRRGGVQQNEKDGNRRGGVQKSEKPGNQHGGVQQNEKDGNQHGGVQQNEKDGNQHGGVQQNIKCYLEICMFIGEINKAHHCLNYYHQNSERRRLLNTSMYNLLMRSFAKRASLAEIGSLFMMLEEADLKPNLESYAAALESMGRSDTNRKTIERCLNQMEEHQMSIDQLFQHFTFVEDERDMVLKAIHCVRPDFKLPPRVQVVCNTPLVNEFYNNEPQTSYPKMDFTESYLQEKFEEQLKFESCETVTINSVEAIKPVTKERIKARAVLADLRSGWKKALHSALSDSKKHLSEISKKSRKVNLYPYLCLLEDEQYVDIMLQSLSKIPPAGDSFLLLSRDLGMKIYNRFLIRRQLQGNYMDRLRYLYKEYCQLLSTEGQISGQLPRELWENLEHEKFGGSCYPNVHSPWPFSLLVQVGTHLVELMVQTIKLSNNMFSPRSEAKLIPVLYHMYSFRSTRQIGLIKPHPIYSQILLDAGETLLTFEAAVMPMLCPPLPWTSTQFGAYLLSPIKLMRCTDGALQHQLLLEKCPPGQLHPVLDCLNQLGICAWRINHPVLDIIVSIFNDKGSKKLDIPPPLSEAPTIPMQEPRTQSSWDKQSHQKELLRCRKKAAEMFSLRMDALYKLSIANHLRDQVFWFPHNMDFRGRTYPCPPYFNHLGSDVTRALLVFAEGQPLGSNGLDWLKVHLINLTGLKKKSSLKERKEYADKIMENILDSADRPLTGRKWWMEADEPWQALACCMEIANASRSPDPAKYISHFPVHQDGSCNGLQHYAALGRDEIGARSVNLLPCDTPQDVYSGVAQQVEEFCKRDAKQGIKIAQVLEGFVGRKLVKQTVMTVVYGVTRYGGRLQIEKRLREMDSFPQVYVWEASHYLVQKVFSSLQEMFSSTRLIQHWLTESARMISKSGNTVEWVTPLGLPIIQPYHRLRSVQFRSKLQAVYMANTHDVNQQPDTMKQKNAFPPNFIHSLDSTHMMLTALHCHSHGLTFVSVHDCFWTHASTVDMMNKVCREQFVSLHSQPILQNLSAFLIQKYCKSVAQTPENLRMFTHFSDVPETGLFNLENVKDSTYFFS
ncbi:DNA-directed RNA polymerase, mitochondrial [Mixophyes fleayi]|uniref:DNA-directed RNA polymerase, mitochondrial n=1 Tax=Mixophyes fleayi TaxID=3061075 RepID=UPI003F4E3B7A